MDRNPGVRVIKVGFLECLVDSPPAPFKGDIPIIDGSMVGDFYKPSINRCYWFCHTGAGVTHHNHEDQGQTLCSGAGSDVWVGGSIKLDLLPGGFSPRIAEWAHLFLVFVGWKIASNH